jgi:NAD(P)H-dependent FMN reductase
MSEMKVAVIYGSTRPGRFCDTVVRWTVERLAASGLFQLDVIDPADPPKGPNADPAAKPADDAAIAELPSLSLRERLAHADAFVIVTPEYNHGYPAPLKALIDSYGAEWHAKPVAFVSYGGASGGLRAVEQLRLVFAELHAVTIRDSVSFPGAWEQFDSSGSLLNPERAQRGMQTLLARLNWWAAALRSARSTIPYTQSA